MVPRSASSGGFGRDGSGSHAAGRSGTPNDMRDRKVEWS